MSVLLLVLVSVPVLVVGQCQLEEDPHNIVSLRLEGGWQLDTQHTLALNPGAGDMDAVEFR